MSNASTSQSGLKVLLSTLLIGLLVYTFFTIRQDGFNFLGAAVTFVGSMDWSGQFSVDFFCYLILSAVWVAWRGQFTTVALLLAVFALFGGFLFLSVYLIFLLNKHGGDLKMVLLGDQINHD
ncbi:MAG: hypothetical protein AAF598_09155 [Bacteroidota bacterium]